jgi:acetyl esterase
MRLDPHVQRIVHMLNAGGAAGASRLTLDERRRGFAKLMQLCGGVPAPVSVADRQVPGAAGPISLRAFSPLGTADAQAPAVIFFHGGGFVAGSLDTHHALCCILAHESGARVLSVEYRLAPEHRFPAAPADACAAAAWIVRHARELAIDPERIAVAGDSAGAILATGVCRELNGKAVRLAAQLLLCPITDFAHEAPSRRELADGYVVDRETIERDLALYLPPGHDRRDPLVSPLHADPLAGQPPAFIHTAEFDPMRDEGQAYAERLSASGVPVIHKRHPGMIHLFYAMGGLVPYARIALREIGAQMRSAFARETVS